MNNSNIIITEHIKQFYKGQDYTISGETLYNGINIKYAIIFDGHGTNDVINFIRNISKHKMNDIMSSNHPGKILFDYINNQKICNKSSGSTMCLARIFPTYVEITNIGDSQAVVFKNKKIEFITKPHNCNNKTEYYRIKLTEHFLEFKNTSNIKMINNNTLYNIESQYVIFNNNTALALTQALGHNGKTGIKPDIYIVNYKDTDNLRILLGSDGFFDMVCKEETTNNILLEDLYEIADLPGQVIINRAITRWLQEWKVCPYLDKSIIELQSFDEDDCDDVSIIIIDIFEKL
jgi:serine/threonine protein phosphatase PrpC